MSPMWRFSLRRLSVPIAVTGLRGTGKTMLSDALFGEISHGYVPAGQSEDRERHRVLVRTSHGKFRSELVVVPGQESEERGNALAHMLEGGSYPEGVIHVVCWGYNKVWKANERAIISEEIKARRNGIDLDSVLAWHRRLELRDFEDTCARLKNAWDHKSRLWLIVAVSKCDLFWPQRAAARDYYLPGSPDGESDFCAALRGLVSYVGEGNLDRLAVVPVSSYIESYEFDPELAGQSTTLDFPQSSNLVSRFRALVGEFCER